MLTVNTSSKRRIGETSSPLQKYKMEIFLIWAAETEESLKANKKFIKFKRESTCPSPLCA